MNKNNTAIFVITLLAVIFAVTVNFVVAAPNAPIALNPITSSSRDLSSLPAQSANAVGGNVTEININTITVTKSWQGYYGNVSGTIVLQDGTNNTFYNWSSAHAKGEIYATRVNSITWTTINCTNITQVATENTFLNLTGSDADSVNNTYSRTTHPAFATGVVNFTANSCGYTTYGYVNNNSQTSSYSMVLLQSGANIVYTTITNSSTVGFDGKQHDFEIMVGENEKTTVGVTPYYFWTEFD